MVVAANMAFAQVKGVARDPKDYEVYQEKIITKEVPVEKEVIKEIPVEKIIKEKAPKFPRHLKSEIERVLNHARRNGKKIPGSIDGFFED